MKTKTGQMKTVDVWSAFCEAQGTRCTHINQAGLRCDGGVTTGTLCQQHQPKVKKQAVGKYGMKFDAIRRWQTRAYEQSLYHAINEGRSTFESERWITMSGRDLAHQAIMFARLSDPALVKRTLTHSLLKPPVVMTSKGAVCTGCDRPVWMAHRTITEHLACESAQQLRVRDDLARQDDAAPKRDRRFLVRNVQQAFNRQGQAVEIVVPESDSRRWVVACRVSGGVTGTRESTVKKDGAIQYFATEAEATATAQCLMQKMNSRYAVASFSYWAEQA